MLGRFVKPILALLATLMLIALLAVPLGPLPALGPLLSPVGGFWSAGGGGSFRASETIHFTQLKEKVTVWKIRSRSIRAGRAAGRSAPTTMT